MDGVIWSWHIKQKCQQNRFCLPIGRLFKLFCSKGSHEGAIKTIIGTQTDLGPVHMGKSYPGYREKFSTSQILLFCSRGETLSHLPGNVSGCDVALNMNWIVSDTTKSYPAKRESCVHGKNIIPRSLRSRLSTSEISIHGKTCCLMWTQCNFSYYFHTKTRSRL